MTEEARKCRLLDEVSHQIDAFLDSDSLSPDEKSEVIEAISLISQLLNNLENQEQSDVET